MASQNIDPLSTTTSGSTKTTEDCGKSEAGCHSVKKRLVVLDEIILFRRHFYTVDWLQQELMKLMMSGDKGISAFPSGDNLFNWIGTINGAQGTVYEGLTYKLSLEFPNNYPYTAPNVRFTTPCFHPNVDDQGNICLDILKDKWTALYDVRTILLSLQSLLAEPNIDSPLNTQAAQLWCDQVTYKRVLHESYDREVRRKQSA